MKLCLINHSFRYELEKLIRLFLPFEKIEFLDTAVNENNSAVTEILNNNGQYTAKATLNFNTKSYSCARVCESIINDNEKDFELALALCLFDCFVNATGYKPPWGILTGVRPAKLFSKLCKSKGEDYAQGYFKNILMVNDKKTALCRQAIAGEEKITSLSKPQSFSLYISVPFCPTRCSYCSFVSHSVDKAEKLIPEYVKLLCREIIETAKIAQKNRLQLETVYIGGGTPTTLSDKQLLEVMNTVRDNFDLSHLREYTVEAGRPDTVTRQKLIAIKQGGATRISINPQTMNDSVLEAIGRRHTSAQMTQAFMLARECGFQNINTDLIAGLPTDTYNSFKSTVSQVLSLNPESVTVHSLAMKRSATMTVSGQIPEIEMGKTASKMVDYAHEALTQSKIVPYYMYRQSKTVGNLENVGYSKAGYECLYNVYIMDETHSILACGASAVTKLRMPNGELIERIFNYKYPYEYITRFCEILSRKVGITEFYEKYPIDN